MDNINPYISHSTDLKILKLAYDNNHEIKRILGIDSNEKKRMNDLLKPLCEYYNISKKRFKKNGDIPFDTNESTSNIGGSLTYHWDLTWADLIGFIYRSLSYNPFYKKYKDSNYNITIKDLIDYYQHLRDSYHKLPTHIKYLLDLQGFSNNIKYLCNLNLFAERYSELMLLHCLGFISPRTEDLSDLMTNLIDIRHKIYTFKSHNMHHFMTSANLTQFLPLYNIDLVFRQVLLTLVTLAPRINFTNKESTFYKILSSNENLDVRRKTYLQFLEKNIPMLFPSTESTLDTLHNTGDKYSKLVSQLVRKANDDFLTPDNTNMYFPEDNDLFISIKQNPHYLSILNNCQSLITTCLYTSVSTQMFFIRETTPEYKE